MHLKEKLRYMKEILDKPLAIIVENKHDIGLEIREILNDEGYEGEVISCNKDAIVAIETLNPMLVIIAINLKKEKNGIDLNNYLLKKQDTPFIYASSVSKTLNLNIGSNTEFKKCFIKPFKTDNLRKMQAILISNLVINNKVIKKSVNVENYIEEKISQTLKYIDQNIDKEFSVTDIAKLTPWKSDHFKSI